LAGHRDPYFSTLKEATAAKEEAGREFLQSVKGRSLGEVIDEYTRDKVQRGLCMVSQPTLKTGQPPMAATHRFYLKLVGRSAQEAAPADSAPARGRTPPS